MGRPSLSDEQVAAFRQKACDVAMSLFGELGYEAFSLRVLARSMGCSHTTPYRYFADKEEIFAEARAEGFRGFAAFLEEGIAGARTPVTRLRRLARGYFDFALEQPAAFRIIFALGQPNPEAYPFVNEAAAAAWGVLLRVVREGVEAGGLHGGGTPPAHVMWAGIHGAATLALAHKLNMGIDGATLVESMTDALLAAHVKRAPSRAHARLSTTPS